MTSTETAVVANPKESQVHPLAADMRYISSWEKWKELWLASTHAEIKHSLLHFGWATGGGTEKVCLYLDLADGYMDQDNFGLPEEKTRSWQFNKCDMDTPLGRFEYASQLRRAVSIKAFQVLCQKFFKNTSTESRQRDQPSWLHWLKEDVVLEKVLWFLRTEGSPGDLSLRNIPRHFDDCDNHQRVLREFAFGISMLALGLTCLKIGDKDCYFRDGTVEGKLRKRHPEIVELLNGLGGLNLLLDERKNSQRELSEAGLAKLREIALRERWIHSPQHEKRKPVSIEEASYAGSKAAQTYLLLQVNNKVQEKLEEIARQKYLAEEAQRKIKELSA